MKRPSSQNSAKRCKASVDCVKKYSDPSPEHIREQEKYLPSSIKEMLDVKTCLKCGHVGKMRYDTIKHILKVHLNQTMFCCNFCSFTEPKLGRLKLHYFQNHDTFETDTDSELSNKTENDAVNDDGSSMSNVKTDGNKKIKYKKTKPGLDRSLYNAVLKMNPENGELQKMRPVIGKYYECKTCLWKFELVQSWKKHQRKACESKQNPANFAVEENAAETNAICVKEEPDLNVTEEQLRACKNLFKCALCDFTTNSESTLVSHVTSHATAAFGINDVVVDYKCPLCQDTHLYSDAMAFSKHFRTKV